MREATKYQLGDMVSFKNEFGETKVGEIVNPDYSGKGNGYYAIALPQYKEHFAYVRHEAEIIALVASKPENLS